MVMPVHDDNPTRRVPVVTYVLIAVNVVAFLISPLANLLGNYGEGPARQCAIHHFLAEYAAIPQEMLSNEQLPQRRGVVVNRATGERYACPANPFTKLPWLSVLTSMFLHGGAIHLLGNMLYLYVFGNNTEDRMGRLRFLLFYLACGYLASYGFALVNPDSTSPLVGASGATAGVLGAYLVLYPRSRVTSLVPFLLFFPFRLPAWVVLVFWFVLQWLPFQIGGASSQDTVAYAAHVFGFLGGMAYALLVLRIARHRRPPPAFTWR